MQLVPLFDFEIRYTTIELLDYGAGGQIYGTMEGSVSGDRIEGTLHLTNLAVRRPDNVNMPTLRGLLETRDGAKLYIEMDGMAMLRSRDQARVFVTSLVMRTGDARYTWVNAVHGVLEGALDVVAVGGVARGHAYQCEADRAQ